MNIKRESLLRLYQFKDYIKACNHNVVEVYCSSIYFKEISGPVISWYVFRGEPPKVDLPCISIQNDVLRSINAICNTKFIFED